MSGEKKDADVLRALYLLDDKQRVLLLKRASPDSIKCICECALNILLGNVPLKSREKKRLAKYVDILRKLADKRKKINKKKIILQSGGGSFLPALLLPVVTTVLSNLLTYWIMLHAKKMRLVPYDNDDDDDDNNNNFNGERDKYFLWVL